MVLITGIVGQPPNLPYNVGMLDSLRWRTPLDHLQYFAKRPSRLVIRTVH